MGWYNPNDAITVAREGWYPAIIESVSMGQTKKGAPMETIAFRVYTPRKEMVIKDYFHPQNLWKYKKLAIALGQLAEFESSGFEAGNFQGKAIEVDLSIESSAQYGDQNKIGAFAASGTNTQGVSGGSVQQGQQQNPPTLTADDIPF